MKLMEGGYIDKSSICAWRIHGRNKRYVRVRAKDELIFIEDRSDLHPGWFTVCFDLWSRP